MEAKANSGIDGEGLITPLLHFPHWDVSCRSVQKKATWMLVVLRSLNDQFVTWPLCGLAIVWRQIQQLTADWQHLTWKSGDHEDERRWGLQNLLPGFVRHSGGGIVYYHRQSGYLFPQKEAGRPVRRTLMKNRAMVNPTGTEISRMMWLRDSRRFAGGSHQATLLCAWKTR